MSTSRILTLATALIAFATGAAAQTPEVADRPATMPGVQPGGAVQPVRDTDIIAHAIFNQLEGRFNGSNSEFRWEGQGWIGTDYDKLWIKSEGTLQGNGTLDGGQHQFLYSGGSRPISICRAGCAATLIHARRATGPHSA